MDLHRMVGQLRQQGNAITTLCADITPDAARWKPAPDSWSLLEVLNHLVDEEVLDFRRHLDHLLHTPEQSWPEIDPMGWVTSKAYNQRLWDESIKHFDAERRKSLNWLIALEEPKWEAAVTFSWGTLSAGDIMVSWLAHDLLHLRQVIELRYYLTSSNNFPFSVDYAGKW